MGERNDGLSHRVPVAGLRPPDAVEQHRGAQARQTLQCLRLVQRCQAHHPVGQDLHQDSAGPHHHQGTEVGIPHHPEGELHAVRGGGRHHDP